jgi:hypothetical protein
MATRQNKTGARRKKPDRAHLEKLLDEALKGTFPASDPVAIDVVEQADEKTVADKPGRKGQS